MGWAGFSEGAGPAQFGALESLLDSSDFGKNSENGLEFLRVGLYNPSPF